MGREINTTMKQADNSPLTVGGVYEDFPENSQIGNFIFKPLPADENKGDWRNWNYTCSCVWTMRPMLPK